MTVYELLMVMGGMFGGFGTLIVFVWRASTSLAGRIATVEADNRNQDREIRDLKGDYRNLSGQINQNHNAVMGAINALTREFDRHGRIVEPAGDKTGAKPI